MSNKIAVGGRYYIYLKRSSATAQKMVTVVPELPAALTLSGFRVVDTHPLCMEFR